MTYRITAVALACAMLSSCAVPDNRTKANTSSKTEVARFAKDAKAEVVIKSTDKPYVKAFQVEYQEPKDAVTLQLSNAPVTTAISGIASPRGYSVVASQGLINNRVNVEIFKLDFEPAVREIAAAAGYAAVFDHQRKAIYLGRVATYTYRVPQHLFETTNMDYSVSSNLSSNGTDSNSGGTGNAGIQPSGGSSQSGSGSNANNTNMKVAGRGTSVLRSFEKAILDIAGKNAQVSLIPETGLLVVRADGGTLRRMTRFVQSFIADAGKQLELKAALVEITLTDEMDYGIDWQKVLRKPSRTIDVGLTTASLVKAPVLNATVTTNTITSVIKALESETSIKVVAEPQLWMLNHQPGIVYNATQRPYLGSVTSSVSGTAAIQTTSGSLSYVMDGVSLAFKPNIIDGEHAELTVIPVLSTAVNPQTFQPGNGLQLTGYDLPTSSSHMKVLLESGKTYIIGGNRFTSQNYQQAGIPGVRQAPGLGSLLSGTNDNKSSRELVLMLHTTISPAPLLNPIVGEAL